MKRTIQDVLQDAAAIKRDDSGMIAFRKHCKTSIPDLATADLDSLFDLRADITKALESVLDKVDLRGTDLNDDESVAVKFGQTVLNCIEDGINYRKANSITGPLTGRPPEVAIRTSVDAKPGSIRSLFPRVELSSGGFRDFREWWQVFASGRHDPRLYEARNQSVSDGAAGGFAVPSLWASMLLDNSLEAEVIRPRATVYPIEAAASLHVPSWDGLDHTSLFGGLSPVWMGEGDTASVQSAKLKTMTLTCKKLGLWGQATRELLDDATGFQNSFSRALAKAIAVSLDDAFLNGNGVGKPLGIIQSPSAISVNRQTANQISFTDLIGMVGRVHPSCFGNSVWIASPTIFAQLAAVKDANNNNLFLTQYAGVAAPIPQTLLGRPLLWSEKAQNLGTRGDLLIADISRYIIGLRMDVIVETSQHIYWEQDKVGFRAILRCDGQPEFNTAITGMRGGATTYSWAVVLDTP